MSLQVVHVRINDASTGEPTPVRVRFVGPDGYIAPLGRLQHFASDKHVCVGGNVKINGKEYAYIDGSCEIVLPAGHIQVEVSKGPEYEPLHHAWDRPAGKLSLRLNIQRRRYMPIEGWWSGDTQVLGLSPRAAWLEGAGEGLHVVNVLAGGDWKLHIIEFSGQAPAFASGECQVVVNTLNCAAEGSLSLLNCHRPIFPLFLPQPGFEKWKIEDWCDQCHRKRGLVVWPNFPQRPFGSEPAEELFRLLDGHIDAVEWTAEEGGPAGPNASHRALAKWYDLLNSGDRIPLVGGSGKRDAENFVGRVRTYVNLPEGSPLTYPKWIEAIRLGQTFVTLGPILRFQVNGQGAGGILRSREALSPLRVLAEAESIESFERLQIIQNGKVIAEKIPTEGRASLSLEISIECRGGYSWLASRCLGKTGPVAHTSPVYVETEP